MAKIIFLGTCCGAEPIPGKQHASLVLEAGGLYYWFDAGENCSRAAVEMGMDLLKVKNIFISHAHIDHMGGLANLIWSIRKCNIMGYGTPPDNKLTLYTPNMQSWNAIFTFLQHSEGNGFAWDVDLKVERLFDGPVYEDEHIKVSVVHNNHIKGMLDGGYLSFSFIIEVGGKRIVYSGDVGGLEDLEPCLKDGCDVLICETGHHKVADVLTLAERYPVGQLLFTHNGREIMNRREAVDKLLAESACNAIICHDRMIFEL